MWFDACMVFNAVRCYAVHCYALLCSAAITRGITRVGGCAASSDTNGRYSNTHLTPTLATAATFFLLQPLNCWIECLSLWSEGHEGEVKPPLSWQCVPPPGRASLVPPPRTCCCCCCMTHNPQTASGRYRVGAAKVHGCTWYMLQGCSTDQSSRLKQHPAP